jgi:hypothetical protein
MAGHSRPKDGVASARLCPGHDGLVARCLLRRTCCDARPSSPRPAFTASPNADLKDRSGANMMRVNRASTQRTGGGGNPDAPSCPAGTAPRVSTTARRSRAAQRTQAASRPCRAFPAAIATARRVLRGRWPAVLGGKSLSKAVGRIRVERNPPIPIEMVGYRGACHRAALSRTLWPQPILRPGIAPFRNAELTFWRYPQRHSALNARLTLRFS